MLCKLHDFAITTITLRFWPPFSVFVQLIYELNRLTVNIPLINMAQYMYSYLDDNNNDFYD